MVFLYQQNVTYSFEIYTCYDYRVGALCLPEINTHWEQEGQAGALRQLFQDVWKASCIQTSRAPKPFLSTYQPGGTVTAVCENWVSRIIGTGEDHLGLGRWTYATQRGRGDKKVTIITAYNASITSGDGPFFQQQMRLLSRLHRQQQNFSLPAPRRQLVLDSQAWIEHLQREGHSIILALEAKETYDLDKDLPSPHPLVFQSGKFTIDAKHDGQFSRLISTCKLSPPLAIQHTTRPFPASHVRGTKQIDYMLLSKDILPAVINSGSLPHHSILHGDHHPYFLDFDSTLLFSDPTYEIATPPTRQLRLQDPRVIQRYREVLHDQFKIHEVEKTSKNFGEGLSRRVLERGLQC